MAYLDSVTVSIAEEITGMLSLILLVNMVVVSVLPGRTEEEAGLIKTSSKV